MKRLVRKNLQVLQEFADELAKMGHGQQQEAVNGALTMFFVSKINEKRFYVRLFRDMRDGTLKIKPRESGHGSVLIGMSGDELQKWIDITDRLFPGPPKYFDEGALYELPDDLKEEKYPPHLRSKPRSLKSTKERRAAKGRRKKDG